MAERVKPRSREAVRPRRRALRATTAPVRMNGGEWLIGSLFTCSLDRGKLSAC
jgi:hypothetical protein